MNKKQNIIQSHKSDITTIMFLLVVVSLVFMFVQKNQASYSSSKKILSSNITSQTTDSDLAQLPTSILNTDVSSGTCGCPACCSVASR